MNLPFLLLCLAVLCLSVPPLAQWPTAPNWPALVAFLLVVAALIYGFTGYHGHLL